jgi:hypothetical protein
MALVTWDVDLDLDDSGGYATAIEQYVHQDDGIKLSPRGRGVDLEGAQPVICTLTLDNSDKRFSPANSGSPYDPDFRPYKRIRIRVTFNAVTYNVFLGIITSIVVNPMLRDQFVYVTATDDSYALSRTDIRLPAMGGVLTGTVIHRIVDLAEIGELCTNTRFKDDLTGYAVAVGATLTRKTTGDILEGAACMETITLASTASGWTYNLLSVTSDGDVLTARVYVIAGTPDDVGRTVTLKGNGTGGSGSSDTTSHTLTDTWEPIEVSWTAGSAGANVQVTAGAAAITTFRTGAHHVTLTKNAIPRNVDGGSYAPSQIAFHRRPAADASEEIRDNELGALFFFDGQGRATFHDHTHRWRESESTSSQATIDETFSELAYEQNADDRVFEVILDYPIFEIGEPGTPMFHLVPVPRTVAPNGTLRIEIDYGGTLVRDTITPVANLDYFIRSQPDGDSAGDDETGNVTLDFEDFGRGAQAILTNTVARVVHVTNFLVRATPIRPPSDLTPARATPTSAPILAGVLTHRYSLLDNERAISSWATYLADRYGETQRERLAMTLIETFPAAPTAGLMAQILGREVGDRVTVVNDDLDSATEINAAFYIDSRSLEIGVNQISSTWVLSPVDVDMFIWDSSSWDGPDVWAP